MAENIPTPNPAQNPDNEAHQFHISEPIRPLQSVQGLREEVKAIKLENEGNLEFNTRTEYWIQQNRIVREAVTSGELTTDEADEIMSVLSAEKEMAEALDPLTQLPNRRELKRRMEEHLALAKRNELPISFAFMDIDHFKTFNDKYNHETGDAVLQQWAGYLKSTLRQSDIVARWGGEEFVILLPNTTEADSVQVMDRIRKEMPEALKEALEAMGFSIDDAITMSVGIAQAQFHDDPHENIVHVMETLPKQADERMYQAKKSGRNKVVSSLPSLEV